MNKKATETFVDNAIHIIFVVFFIAGMAIFFWSRMNGAPIWADYYAKETVKTINLAHPGETIILDIHEATKIAIKNGVPTFSEIVTIDNIENEVCYKLAPGRKTCFNYFNDVDIIYDIEEGAPINILKLEIREPENA